MRYGGIARYVQDKAVKARKKIITAAQDIDTNTTTTVSANTGGGGGGDLLPSALQQHGQGRLQPEANSGANPCPPARAQVGNKRSHDGGTKGHASELTPSQACGRPAQTSSPPALASSPRSPRLGHPRSLSVSWSSLSLTAACPPPAVPAASPGGEISTGTGRDKRVEHDSEDVSGGGFEASAVEASSGGGDGGQRGERKAAARGGGGLTVVIPPVGSGAVVGHLRSPSEIMLDDIAESLADTTRKPSFARMQSVQVGVLPCVAVWLLFRATATRVSPTAGRSCSKYVHRERCAMCDVKRPSANTGSYLSPRPITGGNNTTEKNNVAID